jgi:hypothetical protein
VLDAAPIQLHTSANQTSGECTARRFFLLDANVVVGYLVRETAKNAKSYERTNALIESVRKRCRNDVVLLVPNLCIPEVLSTLAKYAYGHWNTKVKTTIDLRLYRRAHDCFSEYLHNGALFEQCELNRYHVLATDLITPIDNRYQLYWRTKSGKKKRVAPMQAADHLLVGMGIVLTRMHGRENFAILSDDDRMARAVNRARSIGRAPAAALRLPARAAELGYTWGPDIYPRILQPGQATIGELRNAFGEWPLPGRKPIGAIVRASTPPGRR